jgi:hypothetical protein
MAQHNGRTQEKATYLLYVLQWLFVDVLQYVPTEARYDIVEGFEGQYGDH